MKIIALLAMFVAFSATAEEEEKPIELPVQCTSRGLCIIPMEALNDMIAAHNALIDRQRELQAQIEHPKCAESIVTEPPKKLPKPQSNI